MPVFRSRDEANDRSFASLDDLLRGLEARDLTTLSGKLEAHAGLNHGLVLRMVGDRLAFMAEDATGLVSFPVAESALVRGLRGEDRDAEGGRRIAQ